MLGDEMRHANKTYTLMRREGALPENVVVIPDMDNMYSITENANVFDLYKVGSLTRRGSESSIHPHSRTLQTKRQDHEVLKCV